MLGVYLEAYEGFELVLAILKRLVATRSRAQV